MRWKEARRLIELFGIIRGNCKLIGAEEAEVAWDHEDAEDVGRRTMIALSARTGHRRKW